MTTKSRKRFGLTAALLAVLALATYAYAHDTERWGGGSSRHASGDLTQEQIQTLDEIRLKYNEQILVLEKELVSKRGEVEPYASRPDADPDRLSAYREELRSLESQIDELEIEARAEAWKALPSDHRAYWTDHDEFCSMGCDWWPHRQWMGRIGSWMERKHEPARHASVAHACCW
jgi:Spy/CpxP family protein refolding chaperone